jgi:hypothetical protein
MKFEIHRGCYRMVFLVGKYAFKVPNLRYGWEAFVNGVLCNIKENRIWDTLDKFPEDAERSLFCPVLFSLGGFLLVQPRCSHLPKGYEVVPIDWVGDCKVENYGVLDGRVVIFDYAGHKG